MNMRISKSGFYVAGEDDVFPNDIIAIAEGINVALFLYMNSGVSIPKKITIGKGSSVTIYGLSSDDVYCSIEVVLKGVSSSLAGNFLFLAEKKKKIDIHVSAISAASGTKIRISSLGIAKNGSAIAFDGGITINKGLSSVEGFVDQENIFIGSSGKISGTPYLDVRSKDVKSGHSLKMEKISDATLFYLRSRGLDRGKSLDFILSGSFKRLFGGLADHDVRLYNNVQMAVEKFLAT